MICFSNSNGIMVGILALLGAIVIIMTLYVVITSWKERIEDR